MNIFKYKIPNFLRNVWLFRRELTEFRWWDYGYTLSMLRRSLEIMATKFEKDGIEEDISRMKKVDKMRRAIEILSNVRGVAHIEMAEKELGKLFSGPVEFKESESHPGSYELVDNETPQEKDHNRKVFNRASEIEESEWKELWEIFKGQDCKSCKLGKKKSWNDWFDGSGMRGWWD